MGHQAHGWQALLHCENGFLAFSGALHIFPTPQARSGYDLERWNATDLWRDAYGDLVDEETVFFAEDAFGEQFCFHHGQIFRFQAETGDLQPVADTLNDWAAIILERPEVETGCDLVRAWAQHGPLGADQRLAPRMPFVLQGAYDLDNLYLADPANSMRFRGNIARQLHDVPDGTPIDIRFTHGPE